MKKRRIAAGLLAVALLVGCGALLFSKLSQGKKNPAVSTFVLEPAGFVVSVHAQGELVPQSQFNFLAPFQGKIEKLANEGKDVKKGEEIGKLDTNELEDKQREAQLDLGSANSDLAQLEQDSRADRIKNDAAVRAAVKDLELKKLELSIILRGPDPQQLRDLELTRQVAKKDFDAAQDGIARKESLVERGILKATDLSESRLELLVKRKDLYVAQAKYALLKAGALPESIEIKRLQVKQAEAVLLIARHKLSTFEHTKGLERKKIQLQIDRRQAQVKQMKEQIGVAHILSPQAGTVVYPKFWHNGNLAKISEGDAVWRSQAFLRVADFSRVLVSSEIDEGEIGRIRVGLPVRVALAKGRSFKGHVKSMSSLAAESANQNQREGAPKVFQAMVQVDETGVYFHPGLTVDLDFITARYEKVLSIPNTAVGKAERSTYVVLEDGSLRTVVLGDRNDDKVIVKAGLKAGDRIRLEALKRS
ncbi:MAG TPA: HlyD family efflux transporter periplasmic adaptor subunit [Chroococcales cyanobacterium]|jgi:HlyD family secretion protein